MKDIFIDLKSIVWVEKIDTKNKSHDLLIQAVESSINELTMHFLNNPYFFYNESDVNCHLFNIIFQKFQSSGLNNSIETADKRYSILLHKEYPTKTRYMKNKKSGQLQKVERGTKGHFDLCVWNPELMNKRKFRAESDSQEQEIKIAIEIILVDNNYHAQTALNHLKRDLMKLSDPENKVELGFMLFFARNWENQEDFKKLAKEQLTLKENTKTRYIEISNDLKINLSLNELTSKP